MENNQNDGSSVRSKRKQIQRRLQRERKRQRKTSQKAAAAKRGDDSTGLDKIKSSTRNDTVTDVEREFQEFNGTLSDWLNPKHPFFRKNFKEKWKTGFTKSQRKMFIELDKSRIKETHIHNVDFPFEVNSDDHCETSPQAYFHINSILELLCSVKGITKEKLKIYDPYYCNGAVIQHLADLGFKNVYNRCEDFYKIIEDGKVPEHDVLLTNPPYSEYHLEKLLEFSSNNERPCLLLMPSFVVGKSFFKKLKGFQFLCPKKRYVYWTPKGLRAKEKQQNHASKLGIRTSPFPSFWYINLFQHSGSTDLVEQYSNQSNHVIIARTDTEIPRSMLC